MRPADICFRRRSGTLEPACTAEPHMALRASSDVPTRVRAGATGRMISPFDQQSHLQQVARSVTLTAVVRLDILAWIDRCAEFTLVMPTGSLPDVEFDEWTRVGASDWGERSAASAAAYGAAVVASCRRGRWLVGVVRCVES